VTEVSDFAHFSPKQAVRGTAVTIGNFDGCHLGHQWLIKETLRLAKLWNARPVAVTFTPRPEAFFTGLQDSLLFTEEQKTRAFGELGIELQIAQRFDQSFSRVTHETFYKDFLKGKLRAKAIVVGDNFRFGHGRGGDAEYLRTQGIADDLAVAIGSAVSHQDARISSTRIRETLQQKGDVSAVTAMLGRPYMIEGTIRRGDQLGRTIGTPTANLEDVGQLLPRFGIYAGHVWMSTDPKARPPLMRRPKEAVPAVFSIGIRPTLENPTPPVRIEAYLLQGQYGPDELYGRRAGYYLEHFLRDEAKFSGLEELKAGIARDVAEARRLLSK
jgi:riboflavin kinase/FMN adenylyltransferase